MTELDYRVAIEALESHVVQTRPIYETAKAIDYLKKAHQEALAKQEQELALQKLHDENERLGLYKDAYGEEHKESVRLQCVVCNTVYANGVPPQVAKQEQGEPDKYVMDIECTKCGAKQSGILTVNTTPQPAQKPLTDEAIATVYWGATGQSLRRQDNVLAHNFARAIEAAHGIKENT